MLIVLLKYIGLIFCFLVIDFFFLLSISIKEDKIETSNMKDIEGRAYYRKYLSQGLAFSVILLGILNFLFAFNLGDTYIVLQYAIYTLSFVSLIFGFALLVMTNIIDFEQMILTKDIRRREKEIESLKMLKKELESLQEESLKKIKEETDKEIKKENNNEEEKNTKETNNKNEK